MPTGLKVTEEIYQEICRLHRDEQLGAERIGKRLNLAKGTVQTSLARYKAERATNGQGQVPSPPAPPLRDVSLDEIPLTFDTQARIAIQGHIVQEYAEAMAEGEKFPPVVLFRDAEAYWIGDGHHRCRAAKQIGYTTIKAEVRDGGAREAFLYACAANTTHGLRRAAGDTRYVVQRLLMDEEWSRWSDREIARRCAVSHPYVGKLRAQLAERRAAHTEPLTGNVSSERTYLTKHGTVATMDTTRIGQRPAPAIDPDDDDDPRITRLSDLLGEPRADETTPAPTVGTSEAPADDRGVPGGTIEEVSGAAVHVVDAPALILSSEAVPEADKRPTFNRTNEMVDWAKWTWNPVTGCEHTCVYCYARDLAERLYPEKFAPTFRPERLKAPHFTKVPPEAETQIGYRNVFVCSMADLFGKWVEQDWIDAVLAEVRAAPQWNFLLLTKFPQRLATIDWPVNAWVGTTVDEQYRVKIAEKAFREVQAPVKWLSCEPLREDLTFDRLDLFDWVVIGGQSASSQAPAFQPPWAWVWHLMQQIGSADIARQARGLPPIEVYWKPNLTVRPQGYPGAPCPAPKEEADA